jgi:hypothetical protein
MEVWRYIWRENYAETIIEFADNELTCDILCNAVQPKPYSFENCPDHIEQSSNRSTSSNNLSSSNRMPFSVNYQRCTIL